MNTNKNNHIPMYCIQSNQYKGKQDKIKLYKI